METNTPIPQKSRAFLKYLKDIRKSRPLSPSQEEELAFRCKNGDKQALHQLVVANLRFVISVAKQYQNSGLTIEDLINEGNIGLIKAANRFEPTKGFKFISYAVWWIRQTILEAIARKSRTIRIPANHIAQYSKISKAEQALEQKLQRAIDISEIAIELKQSEPKLNATLQSYPNQMVYEEAQCYERLTPTDHHLDIESLKVDINELLKSLNKLEHEVLELFFGLNATEKHDLSAIASMKKLTKERIRQLKMEALNKLKSHTNSSVLKQYL